MEIIKEETECAVAWHDIFYKDNRDKEVLLFVSFEEMSESVISVESSVALYTLLR
jgi:hypothetical protein